MSSVVETPENRTKHANRSTSPSRTAGHVRCLEVVAFDVSSRHGISSLNIACCTRRNSHEEVLHEERHSDEMRIDSSHLQHSPPRSWFRFCVGKVVKPYYDRVGRAQPHSLDGMVDVWACTRSRPLVGDVVHVCRVTYQGSMRQRHKNNARV